MATNIKASYFGTLYCLNNYLLLYWFNATRSTVFEAALHFVYICYSMNEQRLINRCYMVAIYLQSRVLNRLYRPVIKIIVLMTHIKRNPLVSMDFVILISLFFYTPWFNFATPRSPSLLATVGYFPVGWRSLTRMPTIKTLERTKTGRRTVN